MSKTTKQLGDMWGASEAFEGGGHSYMRDGRWGVMWDDEGATVVHAEDGAEYDGSEGHFTGPDALQDAVNFAEGLAEDDAGDLS